MSRPESNSLSTNAVREHMRDGGDLRYEPFQTEEDRTFWTVRAVYPDGREKQVVVGRSGDPKIFRTPTAVYHYHLAVAPEAGGVFIPSPVEKQNLKEADA